MLCSFVLTVVNYGPELVTCYDSNHVAKVPEHAHYESLLGPEDLAEDPQACHTLLSFARLSRGTRPVQDASVRICDFSRLLIGATQGELCCAEGVHPHVLNFVSLLQTEEQEDSRDEGQPA